MRRTRLTHHQEAATVAGRTSYARSTLAMDTFVTVEAASARTNGEVQAAIERALAWFGEVERVCTRFDPESELARLCTRPGVGVPVSALLFEVVAFAMEVARLTRGAFDPTVGGAQQARGFTRNYVSGRSITSQVGPGTYRDVRLDSARKTITLRRPLLLDLGAVAKGFAIDLAARELAGLERFAVEAGGDLFAGGAADALAAWRVGVQDPCGDGLLGALTVRNQAVCSSGGSERPAKVAGEHHLLDPRSGRSPRMVAGVTVVAPATIVADALSTAAFILGPEQGLRLLEEQGVDGIVVTATGEIRTTAGWTGELEWTTLRS
jgi:FAD:protein FMN transferase